MASLHKVRDQGDFDMEAWEEAIRNAVLRYGAKLLEGLLAKAGCGRRDAPVLDAEGQPMHSIGVRQKTLTTLLGKVTLRRSVFKETPQATARVSRWTRALASQALPFPPACAALWPGLGAVLPSSMPARIC